MKSADVFFFILLLLFLWGFFYFFIFIFFPSGGKIGINRIDRYKASTGTTGRKSSNSFLLGAGEITPDYYY